MPGVSVPASRVCPRPGCPNLQPCPEHRRPTTAQRGYGNRYRREADKVKATATHCGNCETELTIKTAGHRQAQRHGGTLTDGLEAQCPTCNYGWRKTGL